MMYIACVLQCKSKHFSNKSISKSKNGSLFLLWICWGKNMDFTDILLMEPSSLADPIHLCIYVGGLAVKALIFLTTSLGWMWLEQLVGSSGCNFERRLRLPKNRTSVLSSFSYRKLWVIQMLGEGYEFLRANCS